jgi:hypothetical protein
VDVNHAVADPCATLNLTNHLCTEIRAFHHTPPSAVYNHPTALSNHTFNHIHTFNRIHTFNHIQYLLPNILSFLTLLSLIVLYIHLM